jgi:Icc-related predicted phosphoesterase
MKSFPVKLSFLYIALTIIVSCVEYSPYEVEQLNNAKNIHEINIQKVEQIVYRDTFCFVFAGDAHRFYNEVADLIPAINNDSEIDFVCFSGDITDFGLQSEYSMMNEIINDLKVPYFVVVGNHDLIYNGSIIYNEMYGDMDFFFDLYSFRFVFVNTNSREYEFNGSVPNISWMRTILNDTLSYDRAIIIMHVPPSSIDFDQNLKRDFFDAMQNPGKTILALNGHHHYFVSSYFGNGTIHHLNACSLEKRKYIKIKIWKGNEIDQSHNFEVVYF